MEKKKLIIYATSVVVIFCVVFLPGFSELNKLQEENQQQEKRIKLLEEHNDKLKEELVKLKEDPDYLEEKAREKLGIIKKGEIIYKKQ